MAAANTHWDDHHTAAALFDEGRYREAFERYRILAEGGSTTAQVFVGWMYEVGRGLERDLEEARLWYERAARAGSANGQFYLGSLYLEQENYGEAIEWLEKAAHQNDPPALFRLGYIYDVGAGVTPDRARAYRYFEQAANLGHLFAQREIAGRMIRGELGLMRIPEGLFALARLLLSVWRVASKDPHSEKLRR